MPQLAVGGLLFRIAKQRCKHLADSLRHERKLGDLPNTLSLAKPCGGLVHDNPAEPRQETGASLEIAGMQDGAQMSILQRIFGVGMVSQNGESQPVEPALMALHEDSIEIPVAGSHALDHGGVGHFPIDMRNVSVRRSCHFTTLSP